MTPRPSHGAIRAGHPGAGGGEVTKHQPLYIRMADAPEVFGLSRDTLERRVKDGVISVRKVGAASLLSVASLDG